MATARVRDAARMLPDDRPGHGQGQGHGRGRGAGRTQRSSSRVVHPHPLLAVPPIAATVLVGMAGGSQAAQRTFLIAGGGALVVEATTRAVIRWHWRRHRWPPDGGSPAALLPVLTVAAWALGWSLAAPSDAAIEAGARASWLLAAIQFTSWLAADRNRNGEPTGRHPDAPGAVTRPRTEEN